MLPSPIATYLDALIAHYCSSTFLDEIKAKREEFDELRGVVFDDEDIYEVHTASFLEWHLFENVLKEVKFKEQIASLVPDGAVVRALQLNLFSIFEVIKQTKDGPLLADLIGGGLFPVASDEVTSELKENDIFEGRILPFDSKLWLGNTLFFHPGSAWEAIHLLLMEEAKVRELTPHLIHELAQLRLQTRRFKHFPLERVYLNRKRSMEWKTTSPNPSKESRSS